MAENARHAMLNSYPSLTYTSETCESVASFLDHSVRVSSSCFVATRRWVTLFSICDSGGAELLEWVAECVEPWYVC